MYNIGSQIAQGLRPQTPCYFVFKVKNTVLIPRYLPKGWDNSISVSRDPNDILNFQSSFIEQLEVFGDERKIILDYFNESGLLCVSTVEFWQIDKHLNETLIFSGEIDFDSLSDKDELLTFNIIESGKYRNYINNLDSDLLISENLDASKIKYFDIVKKQVQDAGASFRDFYQAGDVTITDLDSRSIGSVLQSLNYSALGLGYFEPNTPEDSEFQYRFYTTTDLPYTSEKSIKLSEFNYNGVIWGDYAGATHASGGLGLTVEIRLSVKNNITDDIEIAHCVVTFYANIGKNSGGYPININIKNGKITASSSKTNDISIELFVPKGDQSNYFTLPPKNTNDDTQYSIGYTFYTYNAKGGHDNIRLRDHDMRADYSQYEQKFKTGQDARIKGVSVKDIITQFSIIQGFSIDFGAYATQLSNLYYSNESLFNNRADILPVINEKMSNIWTFITNALAAVPDIVFQADTNDLSINLISVNDFVNSVSGDYLDIIPTEEVSMQSDAKQNIQTILIGNDTGEKDKQIGLIEPCSQLTIKTNDFLKDSKILQIPFSLAGTDMEDLANQLSDASDPSNTGTVKLDKPFVFDTKDGAIKTFTYGDAGKPEALYGYFINEIFDKKNISNTLKPLTALYSQPNQVTVMSNEKLSLSDNNSNNIIDLFSNKRLKPFTIECQIFYNDLIGKAIKSGNINFYSFYNGKQTLVTKLAYNYAQNFVTLEFKEFY